MQHGGTFAVEPDAAHGEVGQGSIIAVNRAFMQGVQTRARELKAQGRPVDEVAPKPVLYQLGIGFENLRMVASENRRSKELGEFKQAVIRLKKTTGLYQEEGYAVSFIGRSLFRATLSLPATVTVGEFTAWVYLFRKGELLSTFKARLNLERSGFEQMVYVFASRLPLLYGITAVAIAVIAGFIASALFRKR